jgi:MtaA/CmuA family methyltransferase
MMNMQKQVMTSKERCLAVLQGKSADRIPVFPLLMFMAANRTGMQYREYAGNGLAMAEAQINMFENYKVDAVTVCSDAFRLSADLGGDIEFPENQTPYLKRHLVAKRIDFENLKRPDPMKKGGRMRDRIESVESLVKNIGQRALVFGWVDMPFAEACDIAGISEFMMMMYNDPELAHEILQFLTDVVIDFSLAQLAMGAPIIGCGDAAASLISQENFVEFALPYEQQVTRAIKEAGGMSKLHICGNSMHILDELATNGADLFNVDHLVDFQKACEVYGKSNKAIKGNMDPVSDLLQASPEEAYVAAKKCIETAKGLSYFLSAGCEIPAEVPDEVYFAFAEAAI